MDSVKQAAEAVVRAAEPPTFSGSSFRFLGLLGASWRGMRKEEKIFLVAVVVSLGDTMAWTCQENEKIRIVIVAKLSAITDVKMAGIYSIVGSRRVENKRETLVRCIQVEQVRQPRAVKLVYITTLASYPTSS